MYHPRIARSDRTRPDPPHRSAREILDLLTELEEGEITEEILRLQAERARLAQRIELLKRAQEISAAPSLDRVDIELLNLTADGNETAAALWKAGAESFARGEERELASALGDRKNILIPITWPSPVARDDATPLSVRDTVERIIAADPSRTWTPQRLQKALADADLPASIGTIRTTLTRLVKSGRVERVGSAEYRAHPGVQRGILHRSLMPLGDASERDDDD